MYNINALSYTSRENPEWFTRAIFGGRLVQSGLIRVLQGIKGDELLSMIDLNNKVLQIDGKDCAWTPNQIIKLSEKKASITTYKINLEQCIDELENKRTAFMLSPGAANTDLPTELEAATLHLVSIALSNEIEEMIVGGDATVPNQFNGMVKTLLLSTDSIQLVGAVITESNVLTAYKAAYDAVPESVLQAEDAGTLTAFASYPTRRKMRNALADKTNQVMYPMFTVDETDKKNPRIYYNGVELIPVKGIDNDTIIIIDASNALLLTDMLSDLENVKLGQFPEPNESKVFIKGRLRLGFVIPFEDEAVIWSASITVAQAGGTDHDAIRLVPNSIVFTAAGEVKTATVITKDTAATITLSQLTPAGFTIVKGTTTLGVTTLTITAAANTGNRDPRVAEIDVTITGTDRNATITLNQTNQDIITITP